MLTPHFLPISFRLYYLALLGFPLFFLKIRESHFRLALLFTPFFFYCLLSASYVEFFGGANEPFPLFRCCLLMCQFFFIIGASSKITDKKEILEIVSLYLKAFFVSMVVGYVLFLGFSFHMISFSTIQRFSIEAQTTPMGSLRFAPGTTANEYGIWSSFFVSILTILVFDRSKPFSISKRYLLIYFILAIVALLLTTTRAAYIACILSLFYIAKNKKNTVMFVFYILSVFFAVCFLLVYFGVDIFNIFKVGFTQRFDSGSLGSRTSFWLDALNVFKDQLLLGNGFASLTNLHNVYLQLLFELGVVGIVLLTGTLLILLIEGFFKRRPRLVENDECSRFLKQVKIIGLIHVLWFAASNHNLNQHLTWFVCFLYCSSFVFEETGQPNRFFQMQRKNRLLS